MNDTHWTTQACDVILYTGQVKILKTRTLVLTHVGIYYLCPQPYLRASV